MKVPCGGFIFNDDEFVLNDQGEVALAGGGGGGGDKEVLYVGDIVEESPDDYIIEYAEGVDYDAMLGFLGVETIGSTYGLMYGPQEIYDVTRDEGGMLFFAAAYAEGTYDEEDPTPVVFTAIIYEDGSVKLGNYPIGGGSSSATEVTTSALSGSLTYLDSMTGIVLSNTTTYPCLEEAMNAFNNGATTVKIPLGEFTGTPLTITGTPLAYYDISASTLLSCSSNGGTAVFDAPFVKVAGEDVNTAYVETTVNMFSGNAEAPIIPTVWKLSFTVDAEDVLSLPKLNIYAALDPGEA